MQFYAYEIARNKRGLNDWVFEKAKEEEKKEVSERLLELEASIVTDELSQSKAEKKKARKASK